MEIQPIVIGTAGHIDHGKSSLVRRLTGIDPDRLKEEKERGLTIDLGFARFELPDGRTVGLIDVPGHERFIRNMVAGSTGLDLVMLVVAADDAVMPQTREHLQIMNMLGVAGGFVALNKIDLVEDEMVELAEEDVRETVAGTFLEGQPILRVSAVTGEGIEELRAHLCQAASKAVPRSSEGVFRMPVQRVFTSRGFGTILTGIPLGGMARPGDVLEVLPGGQKGKVRGIQAYGEKAESARAGHSSALNIPDIELRSVHRGFVVATPNFFSPVRMVGARLSVLPDLPRPVANRTPIRLHTGTADLLGEVVLLDAEELAPGQDGLVQLRMIEPVVCAPGDRFILRLASPTITLGGGTVLEESRYRLKRFKQFVLGELGSLEESMGSPAALLESVLARSGYELQTPADLAHSIKLSEAETERLLAELGAEGRVAQLRSGSARAGGWMHVDRLEEAAGKLRQEIDAWFEQNPLRQVVSVLDLKGRTGFEAGFLSALLEREAASDRLTVESGGQVRPAGRSVELDPETAELRRTLLELLTGAGFQPPSPSDIATQLHVPDKQLERLFELLLDEGSVRRIQADMFLAGSVAERAQAAIVANCERNGQLVIPELRDELGTTRKFLIPLLEYFDVQGLTMRQAGHRVLKRR